MPAEGEFDLMTGLAQPLPVRVICDVLGLPPDDFARTKLWSDAPALIVEPVSRRATRIASNRAAEEMVAYLRAHIAQPALAARAVDEALRSEASVHMVALHTVEPYVLGDTVIPADQTLYFMRGAANRDPAVFSDAERFDITRSPNPHLAFGAGIHYCLGAGLARLEAETAFTRLLQRYPVLALADPQPHWRKLINLRGLEALRLSTFG